MTFFIPDWNTSNFKFGGEAALVLPFGEKLALTKNTQDAVDGREDGEESKE